MAQWQFAANDDTCESLLTAYAEKGRHYHTQEHVTACLRHFDRCAHRLSEPREVELALWFHDAIYKPLSSSNEADSAAWAVSFLRNNDAQPEVVARVEQLIMVTAHDAPTATHDESLLVDIDLSILGADEKTYAMFERAVRREYWMVPMFLYRKKRAEVLAGFLQRERIFQNEPLWTEREAPARANLTAAIESLQT